MKKVIKVYARKSQKLITLPTAILEETGLDEETELLIENKGNKIIIQGVK